MYFVYPDYEQLKSPKSTYWESFNFHFFYTCFPLKTSDLKLNTFWRWFIYIYFKYLWIFTELGWRPRVPYTIWRFLVNDGCNISNIIIIWSHEPKIGHGMSWIGILNHFWNNLKLICSATFISISVACQIPMAQVWTSYPIILLLPKPFKIQHLLHFGP